MSNATHNMNLTDIAVGDLRQITDLLTGYLHESDGGPVLVAAVGLLDQLERYICELDDFVCEQLGELKFTSTMCEGFSF